MKTMILLAVAALSMVAFSQDDDKSFKDVRPIVLIDNKDIKIASRALSVEALADKLENAISKIGVYRVITKRSLGRGIEEGDVFAALAEGGEKLASIKVPAYRMELSVTRYNADVARKTMEKYEYDNNYNRVKRTWEVVADRCNAEIIVKTIDMKSTETVLSKKYEDSFQSEFRNADKHGSDRPNAQLLNKLVDKLVDRFVLDFVRMQNFSVLSCSESGEILVDVPSTLVKVGSELLLVSRGEAVRSRRTGRVSYSEKPVASLIVKTVSEDTCTAGFKKVTDVNSKWENVVVRVLSIK